MDKPKIFISYAREDSDVAQRLYDDLRREGIELWYDKENLLPGKDWKIEIEKAVSDSTIFLPLLSSKSVSKRGFTQVELKRALDVIDEKPEGSMFIIPIRLDDCKVDTRLQHIQWLDLFPSYSEGLKKLIDVLNIAIFSKPSRAWERK